MTSEAFRGRRPTKVDWCEKDRVTLITIPGSSAEPALPSRPVQPWKARYRSLRVSLPSSIFLRPTCSSAGAAIAARVAGISVPALDRATKGVRAEADLLYGVNGAARISPRRSACRDGRPPIVPRIADTQWRGASHRRHAGLDDFRYYKSGIYEHAMAMK